MLLFMHRAIAMNNFLYFPALRMHNKAHVSLNNKWGELGNQVFYKKVLFLKLEKV